MMVLTNFPEDISLLESDPSFTSVTPLLLIKRHSSPGVPFLPSVVTPYPIAPFFCSPMLKGSFSGSKKMTIFPNFFTFLEWLRNVFFFKPLQNLQNYYPPLESGLLNSLHRSADCKHTLGSRQGWQPLGVGGLRNPSTPYTSPLPL